MNHLYFVRVNDRYYLFQYDGHVSVEEIQKLVYERLYGQPPKEVGDNNPPLWVIAVSPLGLRDLVEISVKVTKEVKVDVGIVIANEMNM